MSTVVAVPSNLKSRIVAEYNLPKEIQTYDVDNNYPQRVFDIIAASGTGSSCSELLKKHLRGRGFLTPGVDDMVVNPGGETLRDVHKMICEDRSRIKGYALHIGYNALLKINSIRHIPLEHVRLGIPDKNNVVSYVAVHTDWNMDKPKTRLKFEPPTYVDVFDPNPQVIMAQIEKAGGFKNWKGQILYVSESGTMRYPLAVADAVLEDLQTDAGVKIWKNRGVMTGFSATHILYHKGKFKSEKEREQFIVDINAYQGHDSSFKIMVVELETEESKPELQKVEQMSKDPIWKDTEETCRDAIIRKYEQPLGLHAIKTPGQLGMTHEWEEAKLNYDERTEDDRNGIGKTFADIFKNWHTGDPSKGNPEFFRVESITGVRQTLSEKLTGDVLKECRSIVESTALQPNQKISLLTTMYPISVETATAWVTVTPTA